MKKGVFMRKVFFNFGKEISFTFIKEKLNNWDSKKFLLTSKKYAKKAKINQTKCFLCENLIHTDVGTFFGIKYRQCKKCSHVFVNKRLSNEKLIKYYSNVDISSTAGYTNKKSIKDRDKLFLPKIEFIKKYAKGKKWLDVGAGDGAAVSVINSLGFIGHGLEGNIQSLNFAKKNRNIHLIPKTLDEINLEEKQNIVSFFGVLEHIADPINALKITNKLLEKNGLVVIEVPNYDSLSSRIQNYTKIADRHLEPITHIMLFTEKSLKFALKHTGFSPIAIWYYGMDVIELLKYLKKINSKFIDSELCNLLCKYTSQFQTIVDKDKKGDFLLMIGRKN